MKLFVTLSLTCLLAAALGQHKQSNSCSGREFLFLLDVSENSRNAASLSWDEEPFQYLIDSFKEFLAELPQGSLIGAYTYSSDAEQGGIIPEGSTAVEALQYVDKIGTLITNGGSWTYRGLKRIQSRPRSDNNLLIVVSSQGSVASSTTHMDNAKSETDRLNGLGWNIRVIGMRGRNSINMAELEYVNGNKKFTILDDGNKPDPKSYILLGKELKNLLKEECGNL